MTQDRQVAVTGWEFGNYVLDEHGQRLLRGDRARHLPPKQFQLLRVLAQSSGMIVDRSRLLDLLWPDEPASDAALAKIVQKARDCLEEPGEDVIRTIYKSGYQLVPQARRIGEAASAAGDLLPICLALKRMADQLDKLPLSALRSTLEIATVCCRRGQHADTMPVFAAASRHLRTLYGDQFPLLQLAEFYRIECQLALNQVDEDSLRAAQRLRPEALAYAEPALDWSRRLSALKCRIEDARMPTPHRAELLTLAARRCA